jgi:hypothetical protein
LDTIGLLNNVAKAMDEIAEGRKGLETEGETEAGRVSYQHGLAKAMGAFKEAFDGSDPRTSILVDHAYVTQERQFCNPHDTDAIGSLKAALTGFEDALRALVIVQDAPLYRGAEQTYPTDSDYRYKEMPMDAFHIACNAHRARLTNTLRAPGLSMTEKAVYQQRRANMGAIRDVYLALQQAALGFEGRVVG